MCVSVKLESDCKAKVEEVVLEKEQVESSVHLLGCVDLPFSRLDIRRLFCPK